MSFAQTAVDASAEAVDSRSELFEAPKTEQLDRIRIQTKPFGYTLFDGGFSSSARMSIHRAIYLYLMLGQ